MDVLEVLNKNGILVGYNDKPWNPEQEAALVKDGAATFTERFRAKCVPVYEKVQRWRLLTTKYDNEIHDYLKDIKARWISHDTNFEQVMREENLTGILGNARVERIIFETKEYTNGRDCEPCEC